MSYVRWSAESDIYIFDHVDGGIECHGCPLVKHDAAGRHYRAETTDEMVEHCKTHIDAGHRVPVWLLGALTEGNG